MSDERPNSRRNLDIAIERVFGANKNQLQIRTLLANAIIGQLLPKGVVKGGSALKLRYGDKTTRFTRDLDTARSENLEAFLEQLDASLKMVGTDSLAVLFEKNPLSQRVFLANTSCNHLKSNWHTTVSLG